jgi:hypothetical protein
MTKRHLYWKFGGAARHALKLDLHAPRYSRSRVRRTLRIAYNAIYLVPWNLYVTARFLYRSRHYTKPYAR